MSNLQLTGIARAKAFGPVPFAEKIISNTISIDLLRKKNTVLVKPKNTDYNISNRAFGVTKRAT